MLKKIGSIVVDSLIASLVAFSVKYFIERMFPSECVTSSHLSAMIVVVFFYIRRNPFPRFWLKEKMTSEKSQD